MELETKVQILDEAVCISQCANALRKGMNPSVLFPTRGKFVVMLTKERHWKHKKGWEKNISIQVTETRYMWTGLDSN